MRSIAAAARARLHRCARVIAVTGSAGKTGTTAMLKACLTPQGATHAPEKSFNNHWGVPLTLARMPAATRFAVIEIGMNHAGEIKPLTKLVRPHIAVVTNVLPVHVGNFSEGEIGVAKAKSEIFEGLKLPDVRPDVESDIAPDVEPRRVAILPRDNPHFETLRTAAKNSGAKIITFGRHGDSNFKLGNVGKSYSGNREVQYVTVEIASNQPPQVGFELGVLGEHIATNACAVLAALVVMDCVVPATLAPLANLMPAEGRGARHVISWSGAGEVLLIDESYNANPASMSAALANLGATDFGGRRIAVLGDMLELAPPDLPHLAIRYHEGLLPDLEAVDCVFCCGWYMRHLYDKLPPNKQGSWSDTSTALVPALLEGLRSGDVVMVKGSLGTNMAPLIAAIKSGNKVG